MRNHAFKIQTIQMYIFSSNHHVPPGIRKVMLMVKLVIFFSIIFCLQVSAGVSAQKVTLNENNARLSKVFNNIRQQTGFDFIISQSILDKADLIAIHVSKIELKEALDILFLKRPYEYEIHDKSILIRQRKVATPFPNLRTLPLLQTIIHGRVTDSTGTPLVGVSVVINRNGSFKSVTLAATNAKGEFEVDAQKGDRISFTYIGYQSQSLVIGDQTEVHIILLIETRELESVAVNTVNTGYQKIRPEQSTGAVSQLGTKEYESRVSTNFLDGLVNKLPGLMINNNVTFTQTLPNGKTTTNSLFQIRGLSTISGNQSPLIVVDGYPTQLTLDMINPNEINSVTVLKDAAAATVYGVRASNGVIVIERKQPITGKTRFDFRTTASFTPKENYSKYRWDANVSDLAIKYAQAAYSTINSGTWNNITNPIPSTAASYTYPAAVYIVAQQKAGLLSDDQAARLFAELGSYNNASDYSKLFLRTAITQTYNLDMSGGSANALYYITANYTGDRLNQDKNSDNRLLLSGRSLLRFSPRFSLELTTEYQEGHSNAAPLADINNIYSYEHLQDGYGNPLPVYGGSNINPYYNNALMAIGFPDNLYYPLVDMNHISDKTHIINNRITANFIYKLGYGFNFSFGGVYEISRTDMKHLADDQSSQARQYVSALASKGTSRPIFNLPQGGFLQQQTANVNSYTVRAQINYNKRIGKDNSINAILGSEVRDETNQTSSTAYFGYNDQTLLQQPVNYANLLNGTFISPYNPSFPKPSYTNLFGLGYTDNRYVSGYSNIVYSFRNKYSLSGSARIDQSNLFGTDPKYRYKPLWSLGGAWNINKENFLKDLEWIKLLKLRIAYGLNGNVAKDVLPQVIAKAGLNTYNSANPISMLSLFSNANSGLRWEQTQNTNLGLDYAIFENITGSIDIYNKKSTDLLATSQIDASKGASSSMINAASMNNRGLEINLHADWIMRKNFNWNTGLVFSFNKSKVLQVYNSRPFSSTYSNVYATGTISNYTKGYPVGAMFSYRYAGLDSAGIPLVYGTNGKANELLGGATGALIMPASDYLTYSGTSIPSRNLGLSNRVDIGNFYFYCMINYYGGFKIRVPAPTFSAVRPLAGAGNYWQQPGDENKSGVLPSASYSNYVQYLSSLDIYTVNGDYFTLGDITASYNIGNLPPLRKIGFTHFEIKLQASNVCTIGLNKYNYSVATGNYAKPYLTPTYTIGVFTNF